MTTPQIGRRGLLGAAAGLAAASTMAEPAQALSLPLLPGPPTRIDVHCHLIPDFYRTSLANHGITTAGGIALPTWSPTEAVGFMNNFGIAAQVVSISEPGVYYLPTPAGRLAMAQQLNNYMKDTLLDGSGIVSKRFGAFAVLPLGDLSPADIANAQAEAKRAMAMGFDGVGLYSNYHGAYLGDPRLNPLMSTLNLLGAMVFVHPVTPPVQPNLDLPTFLFEFPFDTTRAAVNLSYKSVFTSYPLIRWLLAHAGGTLPFLAYRTSLLQYVAPIMQNLDIALLDKQNFDYGRLFYDTALSPAPSAMKSVREVTSVSHIMFASDWPFSKQIFTIPGDPAPQLPETFNSTELPLVLRGNALAQMPNLRKRLSS